MKQKATPKVKMRTTADVKKAVKKTMPSASMMKQMMKGDK